MRNEGFNKKTGIFIIAYHVLLVIGWFFYFSLCTPTLGVVISAIVLFFLTGLSITGGYHRYYAHCTYKTQPAVEAVLLFFASMATQASALKWSFEHRCHHAYVDTDRDPYSINKGFWHAHILWLFKQPAPIDKKVVADLYKNPLVMFQHNNYLACMLGSNLIAFLAVGYFFGDFLGAFVLAWWTRLFLLHHSTWFINSLAHYWGSQSFSKEQSAVDNYVISFLTFGEGYHNYHHTFANDYRNGVRWYHFDPTKWLIWTLYRLGLADNLKSVNNYHIKERIVTTHREELLESIQKSFSSKKEEIMNYVSNATEDIVAKIGHARKLVEEYSKCKEQNPAEKETLRSLKSEIKQVQKAIRHDWKACQKFSRQALQQ